MDRGTSQSMGLQRIRHTSNTKPCQFFLLPRTNIFKVLEFMPETILKASNIISGGIDVNILTCGETEAQEGMYCPQAWWAADSNPGNLAVEPRSSLLLWTTSGQSPLWSLLAIPRLCLTWALSVQFSSVTQSCPTLCNPMNSSTPGLPVHHKLPEFTQTHAHRVSDAIQPSHPLSSPSPPAPSPSQHQGLFQRVNSSHEVAKVLEFQLQRQSF